MINCLMFFQKKQKCLECVLRRVNETLEMIENSAESNRGYQKEEKTGKVINGTDRMGKIGTRKNWKRSLILTFAAVRVFGATVFAAEKYIGISWIFPGSLEIRCRKKPRSDEKDRAAGRWRFHSYLHREGSPL